MNIAAIYDTETTGLPLYKEPSEDPSQPHIVQVGVRLVCLETRKLVASINLIVQPDGWLIPQDTIEIHGITQDHALRVGVPEDLAVDAVYAMAAKADVRIGFNESYDARIMRIGLKRQGDEAAAEAFKAQPTFCVMRACQKVLGGRQPNLAEAHRQLCGHPVEDAHTAMGDAISTENIYWALVERGLGWAGNSDVVGMG